MVWAAPSIADNSISTIKIIDANITTAKIADANITYAKLNLNDNDIPLSKLYKTGATANTVLKFDGTNAVWAAAPSGTIADGSITYAKLNLNDYVIPLKKLSNIDAAAGNVLTYGANGNIYWNNITPPVSNLQEIDDYTRQINFNPYNLPNPVEYMIFNSKAPGAGQQLYFSITNEAAVPPSTDYKFMYYKANSNGTTRSIQFGDIWNGAGKIEILRDQYGSSYIYLSKGANYFVVNQAPHSQPYEFYYNGSRIAYLNNSGYFYAVSSEMKKTSIQIKNNNDVLNRLLRLKIYSYKFKENCNDLITGLIISKELYELFPNIIKFKDFDTGKRPTWDQLTEKKN